MNEIDKKIAALTCKRANLKAEFQMVKSAINMIEGEIHRLKRQKKAIETGRFGLLLLNTR